MDDVKSMTEAAVATSQQGIQDPVPAKKLQWETPKLEDVSEQVMAQPYIRFT